MCAIIGIIGKKNISPDLYDGLTILQHRGQDAAGIMTCEETQLHLRKGNGLVRDVIQSWHIKQLLGSIGIGHVRYPTAGSDNQAQAQPFFVNSPYGLALAHNGNLTNTEALRQELWQAELRHLNTSSDSEVLLNVFAYELQKIHALPLTPEAIFKAVAAVHLRCQGAYAALVMIAGYGIVAFRDPYGIRPLCYGVRETPAGNEYMFASESVALDALGFKHLGDVAPGEAIYVDKDGKLHRKQCAKQFQCSPCLFEYVYLSRPDSVIDKILVYKVRLQLGESLAKKIEETWLNHDIDVVMPVPDTSRTAAYSLSLKLGLKYREGFVKNHYIGRTFIMPDQSQRQKSVKRKLNTIPLEFKDKNVLLVDDSIVRGTTSKEIIQMAREAGAKKVYFASAAPEVRFPNVYGIDMPAANELIAHDHNVEEICQQIGADKLIFQDLEALVQAAQKGNPAISHFEDSVFTGKYITGTVTEAYLANLAVSRRDAAKGTVNDMQSVDFLDEN